MKVSMVNAIAIVLIVVIAGVAVYGWIRPIPEKTITVEESLEDLAKTEGTVTIYSSMDTPDFENVMKPAFLKVYPWAHTNFVGLDAQDVSSRMTTEYTAGHVTMDVAVNGFPVTYTAIQAGAAENWINPMIALMAYPNGTYDPQGSWGPTYSLPICIAYNTNLVNASEVPTSYQGLGDPKWDHKIAMEDPAVLQVTAALFAHLYPTMGNASWTSFMQSIAANHPVLTESSSDAFSKLALGEASISLIFVNDFLGMSPGTPINVTWIEPATAFTVIGVLAKNAPHPNMAKLFMEWLASADGQYALARTGRIPLNPAIAKDTLLKGLLPEGMNIVVADSNNPDFVANPGNWSTLFRSIFG